MWVALAAITWLFAQGKGEGSDTSAVAAWVTAAGTSSIAGVLALVMRWLLWTHLPEKDRIFQEMVKSRDDLSRDLAAKADTSYREHAARMEQVVRELVTSNAATDKERRADFQAALEVVTHHCEQQVLADREANRLQFGEVVLALRDVREVMEELRDRLSAASGHPHPRRPREAPPREAS